MSAIANQGSGYKAVKLAATNDSVAGRIVSFEDYHTKDFKTGESKFFPSGDPILGTRIVLDTDPTKPDDDSSYVTLHAEKVNMLRAIAAAVRGAGKVDIEVGGDLAVTRTGMDGNAQTFSAAYSAPEAEDAKVAA